MLDTFSLKTHAQPAALTRFLQVAHHRHALLARLAFTAPLLLLRVLHVELVQARAHLLGLHLVVPDTPWPTMPWPIMSVLPVPQILFLQVAHPRHALFARLALTVPLLLHRALHVVRV